MLLWTKVNKGVAMEDIISILNSLRSCSYCNAKEGLLRPVGLFIVELTEAEVHDETVYACQKCKVLHKSFLDATRERDSTRPSSYLQ